MKPPPPSDSRPLDAESRGTPVTLGVTVGATDSPVRHAVFCERRGQLVPLTECGACTNVTAMPVRPSASGSVVHCKDPELRTGFTVDLSGAVGTTPVGAVLRERFICAQVDTSWETLEALLLDRHAGAVPIVDSEGRPVGIVSSADLLDSSREHLGGQRRVAGDIMTPHVYTLPEDAPLSFAVALLAVEDISFVPVVSADGKVTGLFAARDALRWFAKKLGYVVRPPGT